MLVYFFSHLPISIFIRIIAKVAIVSSKTKRDGNGSCVEMIIGAEVVEPAGKGGGLIVVA